METSACLDEDTMHMRVKQSNTLQTPQPTIGARPKQPGVFASGCIIGCQLWYGKRIANCGYHYA